MSTPLKVLIMLALWLLYTLIAFKGCIEPCCSDGVADETAVVVPEEEKDSVAVKRYPIDFQWGDATAFKNEGFDAYRTQLLAEQQEKDVLQITGYYYDGEAAPAGFENMGLARAAAIRKMFPEVPDDRIVLRARKKDGGEELRKVYLEAYDMAWADPPAVARDTSVQVLDDRIIIRFPYNSTTKIADPAVDEYLVKLAARMKESGERVLLTGHTDSKGNPETNMTLGRRRAEAVRNVLVGKGVNKAQIDVASKGITEPVASNDTEEGRQENRRVEVRILK